ncbi:hypothetical protein [Lacticaseibacillus paracasei]|uniref:hypothetical protein n=1 Tax=Lacticaseibacillus paracasei TaxID=1597 RepID=UPI0021A34775|nr:hypothetical protein [Lacticaseibacillus paracasei]
MTITAIRYISEFKQTLIDLYDIGRITFHCIFLFKEVRSMEVTHTVFVVLQEIKVATH